MEDEFIFTETAIATRLPAPTIQITGELTSPDGSVAEIAIVYTIFEQGVTDVVSSINDELSGDEGNLALQFVLMTGPEGEARIYAEYESTLGVLLDLEPGLAIGDFIDSIILLPGPGPTSPPPTDTGGSDATGEFDLMI